MSNVDEWAGRVPGAFNLRDLGGIPVEDGTIAPGRVYRCDLLHRVDHDLGAQWLRDHDVGTLIDLRTLGEREGDGFMAASEHLDSLHRGLLDEVWSWEAENQASDDWFLRDRTIEMYEQFPDRIALVLRDIADAPRNVLFHCTAGKDRTGVIASALLGVLGASHDVIAADYARSTDAMPGIIGWYRDQVPDAPRDHEREALIIARAATEATMRGVIDELVRRHGSFAGWAADSGIDADLIGALRAKLVTT